MIAFFDKYTLFKRHYRQQLRVYIMEIIKAATIGNAQSVVDEATVAVDAVTEPVVAK